jgi:hypothetical protein
VKGQIVAVLVWKQVRNSMHVVEPGMEAFR